MPAHERTVNVRRDGPCPIRVVVRESDNPDVIIHDRYGDHNYGDFREWIDKTVYWAVRNGKTVSMYPNAD